MSSLHTVDESTVFLDSSFGIGIHIVNWPIHYPSGITSKNLFSEKIQINE